MATKVKGTASTGDYNNYTNAVVYDAMDLIHPPIESNALFITTAMTHTFAQTRDICGGNSDISSCTTDDDCDYNDYNWKSQGILTGKCAANGRCEGTETKYIVILYMSIYFDIFSCSIYNIENIQI